MGEAQRHQTLQHFTDSFPQSNLFIIHLERLIGMARDPEALFQASEPFNILPE
jgi:hypothetical protein